MDIEDKVLLAPGVPIQVDGGRLGVIIGPKMDDDYWLVEFSNGECETFYYAFLHIIG